MYFNSSGSSSSSYECGVPALSAEEVGQQLHLDPKVISWLKNEQPSDDDPVLVLSYQETFFGYGNFELNKQTVSNAMINAGAKCVSDNVFKFDTWLMMYEARDQMMIEMPWAFFSLSPVLFGTQHYQLSQKPTITTSVISYFSENAKKLTMQPYQFFKL